MSKKLRNRFIALCCLLLFVGLGALYYTNWVVQKPFAIILFVADGLTPSLLTPARIYQGGAEHRLAIESLPHLAILTTYANDFAVADTAAAASSIATGQKINNRNLAVDAAGRPLTSILELARKSGRLVGLVSNASLTDAAPAAFYARSTDPLDHESIAAQLVEGSNLDLVFGGGGADFLPESKEGGRKDGRDLMLELRRGGYDIIRTRSELENTPAWRAPRVFGIFSMGNLAFADEVDASSSQPSLSDLVRQAIQLLQYNPKGYLLVVDASLITKACVQNEGERALRELLELDRAVATALEYAGKKALVVVAGVQPVGGLRMNGYPFKNDRGVAVLGANSRGIPFITWSTGPGGPQPNRIPAEDGPPPAPAHRSEPAAAHAPAAIGVAEDVIAVSTGPDSEKLQGFKDNTDVFRLIRSNL
jgi:alkaline phosphatase